MFKAVPHAGRRLPLIGILKIAFYDEAIGVLARGFSKRIELGDIIPLQFILLVQDFVLGLRRRLRLAHPVGIFLQARAGQPS